MRVAVLALLFGAGPARGADSIQEIELHWKSVEKHQKIGDLANLKLSLDLIHQELGRRVQMGFLSESDAYTRATRDRVARLRKWLDPQLNFYAELVTTADELATGTWNLGLFQGGKERFEKYADLLRRLDEAEKLSASYVKAFSEADQSPPIKKLASARKNLEAERSRATAAWLRQANEQFDLAVSREEAVPPAVHVSLLQVRALDPENGEMMALITRLGAYHQKRYEDLSRRKALPRLFPDADQASLARFKDELKAAYYRRDPMSSIKRFTFPEQPALWIEAKSGAERQSLPALLGTRSPEGKCELKRVWYYTSRERGQTAYTPFEISGVEKLSPLDCAALE
ncbi:MAG: hypothetical protein P1V51_10000 [Deltaproteobacteria bacterium]|nr:hypothetical protein [Deltaproteobacteria bacterium]